VCAVTQIISTDTDCRTEGTVRAAGCPDTAMLEDTLSSHSNLCSTITLSSVDKADPVL